MTTNHAQEPGLEFASGVVFNDAGDGEPKELGLAEGRRENRSRESASEILKGACGFRHRDAMPEREDLPGEGLRPMNTNPGLVPALTWNGDVDDWRITVVSD